MTCVNCGRFQPDPNHAIAYSGPICGCDAFSRLANKDLGEPWPRFSVQYTSANHRDDEIIRLLTDILEEMKEANASLNQLYRMGI